MIIGILMKWKKKYAWFTQFQDKFTHLPKFLKAYFKQKIQPKEIKTKQ